MSLYHPLGIEPPASVAGHPPVSLRAPSVPPAVTRPCPCSLGRLALAEGLGLQRPPVPQDPGPEAPAGELEESGPPALTCSGSAGAPHLLLLSLPSAVLSHRFPSANLVDCVSHLPLLPLPLSLPLPPSPAPSPVPSPAHFIQEHHHSGFSFSCHP